MNAYLLPGWPPVLIDAGPAEKGAWMLLEDTLARLGISAREIEHIFLTHGHLDHSGAAAYFSENFGTAVWSHSKELPRLNGQQEGFFRDHLPDMFTRLGVPPETTKKYAPAIQKRALSYQTRMPVEVKDLIPGERLPVEGYDLTAIFTPGHSFGSVCFFESRQGIIFAGDTLLPGKPPRPTVSVDALGRPYFNGVAELLKSLDFLPARDEVRVLPGHGSEADLQELIHKARNRIAKGKALVMKRIKPDCTPYDLIHKRVLRTRGSLLLSDLYQTRCVLEALLADNRVVLEVRRGVEYFSPI